MIQDESRGVAVGIDIGGTTIKLGLAEAGQVVARQRIPYAQLRSFDDLVEQVASSVRAMETEAGREAEALGIAAPGHARSEDGRMVDGTANVPLLRDRSLLGALRDRIGLPAATINDGSAATLGELHFGAGRGLSRFALLTLGTGVGGGIVIDGRLVTGVGGVPPELGAIVLDDAASGPRTLEDFASAGGFAAAYRHAGGEGTLAPTDIFLRAAAGQGAAAAAIEAVGRRIAQGLGTLTNALNLEACLIGGGIAQAGDPLLHCIRGQLPQFTWPFLMARVRVALARTGQDAGILGASLTALRQHRRSRQRTSGV
jgi:glucokinase